jgi:hypothetical protein
MFDPILSQPTDYVKGLIVGTYRSHDRDSYMDWQEFLEDSLFEFLTDHQGFDDAEQGSILPLLMQRQTSTATLHHVTDLLQLLRVEHPQVMLDIPYLYCGINPHFMALVFDNCQQYLAVFLRRSGH